MAITLNGSTGIQNVLGSAASPAESNTSSSNTGLYFPSSTTLGLSTNGTNALYIDASQNVGIGTTSPGVKLQVNAGASVVASFFGNNANNYIQISDNNGTNVATVGSIAGGNFYSYSAGYNASYAGGSECMRINSSGNVGIGTSSPGQKLVVAGNIQANYGNIYASGANSSSYAVFDVSNPSGVEVQIGANGNAYGDFRVVTNHPALFYTNNTERMRIDSSGNLLVGTTSSKGKLTLNGYNTITAYGDLIAQFASAGTSTTSWINLQASNSGYGASLGISGDNLLFGTNLSNGTGVSERMRIDTSGNLLVGTTSTPTSAVSVLAMGNATAPSASITGGIIYVSSGALYFRGSSGTVTKIANA